MNNTNPGGLVPLMSMDDLAAFLGVPVATLYDWRVDGKGPVGIRVGRHVRFTREDVAAWVAANREQTPGGNLIGPPRTPANRAPSGKTATPSPSRAAERR
jgi:excisionase family DNA binding protein